MSYPNLQSYRQHTKQVTTLVERQASLAMTQSSFKPNKIKVNHALSNIDELPLTKLNCRALLLITLADCDTATAEQTIRYFNLNFN